MRRFILVCVLVGVCMPASGNVTLGIPSPGSILPANFSLDLPLTASSGTQSLAGYDLYLQITSGSGLTITGPDSNLPPNPVFPSSKPSFSVEADANAAGGRLYYFGDFSSTAGTIGVNANLLRADFAATKGGTYSITAYVNASDSMTTAFYSDFVPDPISVSYSSGTVIVAWPGDANLDGKVDVNDLTIVLTHFGQTAGMSWATGDFNDDGRVDVNDLTILLTDFGQSLGSSGAGMATVPEPSTLVLVTIGIIGLLGFGGQRRKRGEWKRILH